jgi:hypothetical protein
MVLLLAVALLYFLAYMVKRLTRETSPSKNRENNGIIILKSLEAAPDWLINNMAEVSKNARQIYFIYIALLVYSTLVVLLPQTKI